MIRGAKFRAKKQGVAYDLDDYKDELGRMVLAGCAVSGLPFKQGGARDWNSPSIDRIKPELGYVFNNVRVILWCLNSLFGYWGEDKAELAARAWIERKDI